MKPEIICKDEKLFLGIARKINQSESIKYGLLKKVRKEFKEMSKFIENRINPELYYAAYDYNPEDIWKEDNEINYTYYYCAEVSGYGKISEGMIRKVVHKAKYAVFSYDGKSGTLNGETINMQVYDYIDGIWLSNSGFELADTSDYEAINEEEKSHRLLHFYKISYN